MKKKFEVIVEKTTWSSKVFIVEAGTEAEAEDIAIDLAKDARFVADDSAYVVQAIDRID